MTWAIQIGQRQRKDFGDLEALKASIEAVGLLHPLAVRPDGLLVAGARRLEAARQLGWDEVPVHVVHNLDEHLRLIQAENEENVCREPFTPSEAAAIAKVLEETFKLPAEDAEKSGKSEDGKAGGRGKKKNPGKTFTRVNRDNSKRTKAKAAQATGYSASTLAKVEEIQQAAVSDPGTFSEVSAKLESHGCKVDRVYKEFQAKVKEKELEEAAAALVDGPEPDVRCCLMEELLPTLAEVDAIITDPPYPAAYLPLYGELARLAKDCLKPGGVTTETIGKSSHQAA